MMGALLLLLLRGLAERVPDDCYRSLTPAAAVTLASPFDFHTLLRAHSFMTWQRNHDSTWRADAA